MKNFLKREYAGHYFSETLSAVPVMLSIAFAVSFTGMLLGGYFVETVIFAGLSIILVREFTEIGKKMDYQKVEGEKSKKVRFFALEEEEREASILTTAVD
ncbi:Hypothetical protein Tpal_2631 [Trichococcus palustris]|jgi:hypothetical protein|uniref:Uncharacterized protein n=1 Tax=Trichococcus palustris TaxID=140314 RepID=A0A143YXX5_9LACT|nr:hypothetical protein [Trichococcus palustris]CZR01302.1 Hypothetical protein Tpal_2631 [Trichococcus palustris]SFL07273.1 hypothetical protein SAMN04488076_11719 [Trichococcus palustris]